MKQNVSRVIILISGATGAGKNFFANALRDDLCDVNGGDVVIGEEFFAKHLKKCCEVISDVVRPHLKNPEDLAHERFYSKRTEVSRRLMQVFGTEIGRVLFGPNVWADLLVRDVTEFFLANNNDDACLQVMIVTDLRFDNELHVVMEAFLDKCIILPVNIVDPTAETKPLDAIHTHASENGLTIIEENYIIVKNIKGQTAPEELLHQFRTELAHKFGHIDDPTISMLWKLSHLRVTFSLFICNDEAIFNNVP